MVRLVLCCLLALSPVASRADSLRVLIVLSDHSSPYETIATSLTNNLPGAIHTTVLDQSEVAARRDPADLIVSVGIKASLTVITMTDVPVLVVMTPKVGFEKLLERASKTATRPPVSAIYLDQSWERQLDFVRAAFPDLRRIGLLYSRSSDFEPTYIRQQVSNRGGTLLTKQVLSSTDLFSNLDDLLGESDILLALPDNTIYNSVTIRNILLSTYRFDVPFIGLSQAYVTAGAIGAIYSTPEQVSDQIVSTVLTFSRNGKLPEPQYPRDFSIALNPEVARSLHIQLYSIEGIRGKMKKAHGGAP
jgi:ABC-type uncharacterized transport system substrate-binding protein